MADMEQSMALPPFEGDLDLLHRYARSREPGAFVELSRRYAGVVYGTCLRITANVHDAEELTQDCFLELARQAATIRSSVGGWLHRLATHRALNAVRSRSRRRMHERGAGDAQSQTDSEPAVSWRHLEPLLDNAIEDLPEELRSPIVLHFLENRSQDEVAQRLGVHQSTVSRRIQTALEALRTRLGELGCTMAIVPLTSLLATHACPSADPGLLASLGKIALAGIGSTATGAAAGGVGTVLSKLFVSGKTLGVAVLPIAIQVVLGGLWGCIWATAILAYLGWRRPKWHEEWNLAMGGKGYQYEFFPLGRWTWTTPPAGWRRAIFQSVMTGMMMGCVAVAILIPRRNAMSFGWSAMMIVYSAVPLVTAFRIWRRVRACPADLRNQPAPPSTPPDALGVVQSVFIAVAATLCAISFGVWHVRRGWPSEWVFLLIILILSACGAQVGMVRKIWNYQRSRRVCHCGNKDTALVQTSSVPRATFGAMLFILFCALGWTFGSWLECVDYLWGRRSFYSQAAGWALCSPLALMFLATTLGLFRRLRGQIPRLVWTGLVTTISAVAAINVGLVLAWLFFGPARLPPLPSQRASTIVGNIGNVLQNKAEAIPQLQKDIHSPNDDVRRRAAILLGLMDAATEEVVPELRRALTDESPEVRSQAAFALAHLGTKATAAIPDLCKALGDPDSDAKFAVLVALNEIGQTPKDAVPALGKAMSDNNAFVRQFSAQLLRRFGEDARDAVPDLARALSDKNENVRSNAALALEHIGEAAKDAIPELRRALSDPSSLARSHAASALGNMGRDGCIAIPDLRQRLTEDDNAEVRWCAAGSLGKMGAVAKDAIPDIQKALSDPDATVRSVAVCSLGKIAPPTETVVFVLQKALRDPAASVRAGAAWSLGEMGPAAEDAIPDLETALHDNDENVRSQAAKALGRIRGGR